MKIYSSQLISTAEVDQGDITITTGDALIIADKNGNTNNAAPDGGLFITGGLVDVGSTAILGVNDHRYYLDGKGQEKDMGLYLVASGNLTTSYELQLFNLAGTQIASNIDLSNLAGGGGGGAAGGASTNEDTDTLPVKFVDGFGRDYFIDSVLHEDATVATEATYFEFTGLTAAAADDDFTATLPSGDNAAFNLIYTTGEEVTIRLNDTVGSDDGDLFQATLSFNTGSSQTLTFTEVAGATEFPAIIAANEIQLLRDEAVRTVSNLDVGIVANGSLAVGNVNIGNATNQTNLTVSGNLTVDGITTTIDSTTLTVEDKFIVGGQLPDSSSPVADQSGGLFINTDKTALNARTYAGLRNNPTNNTWELTNDATSDSGTTGAWEEILHQGSIDGTTLTFTAGTSDHGSVGVTANGINANELNVSGNGTDGQVLESDGDGSFSWGTPAGGTTNKATVVLSIAQAVSSSVPEVASISRVTYDGTAVTSASTIATSGTASTVVFSAVSADAVSQTATTIRLDTGADGGSMAYRTIPIVDQDAIVQVFEGSDQIIPDNVSVVAGVITISLPPQYSNAALKIVIIG